MFHPAPSDIAHFINEDGPWLLVTIDAEEEFDWTTISTAAQSVNSLKFQCKAHEIYDHYGLKPTYFVDYPVINQDAGYKPLYELYSQDMCHIGAHLHPWVNPPYVEEISFKNSYPGNLDQELEYEKLSTLTDLIEHRFGARPTSYRAGRYGAGPHTGAVLEQLGYETDLSVLPLTDLRRQEGPDFRACPAQPYWFGKDRQLLEIPMTVGLLGLLSPFGAALHSALDRPLSEQIKLWAFLARSRILDRIKLSPEGVSLNEAKRLTRSLLTQGHKIFVITYHSSSLVPGNTPYVTSPHELDNFLSWIDAYLHFFLNEMGGTSASPDFILEQARKNRRAQDYPSDTPTAPARASQASLSRPSVINRSS